jgi:hypothetical protein
MITETKEVYKCEHCRKLYQIKSACISHEPKCKKNPDNFKICHGCEFLEKKEVEVNFQDHNGYDHFRKKKLLHCNKLNKYVFPLSIENSGYGGYLQEDIGDGDIENEPMPKKCESFESFKGLF